MDGMLDGRIRGCHERLQGGIIVEELARID